MTEQVQEQKPPAADAAPPPPQGGDAAAAGPEAPPPLPADLAEAKEGLMQRLNPMRLFRKDTPEAFIKEGHRLVDNQNLAQATMAFNRALGLDPNSVDAYKGLGGVFLRKGGRTNNETALNFYKEAIKRNPFDESAYSFTAKIHERLGHMKEATLERKKMMIIKTLDSDATNPVANNNMGILLLQLQQVQQAIAYFKKAISANPNYDVALRNLAATYYRLAAAGQEMEEGNSTIEMGQSLITKALSINQTVSSLLIQGKLLALQERYDEALKAAEAATVLDGASREAVGFKKLMLEKLNRTSEAQEAFESYQSLSGAGAGD